MTRPMLLIAGVAMVATAGVAIAQRASPTLQAAVKSDKRTPANVLRDRYRHPAETLAFFGVKPTDTVVEIWPGGGWYTEILAPYLAAKGTYYATALADKGHDGVRKLMAADAARYGKIKLATFPAFDGAAGGVPAGTADVVLTFRNVHNWQMGYQREKVAYAQEAFDQAFKMLKPGGTFGVVDHRLPENADGAREKTSGYAKVSSVKAMAAKAGFRLAGSSEVNANPKDTADWANGVWTLPPSLALKDVDRAKYVAIGESDRMTLKFTKPK